MNRNAGPENARAVLYAGSHSIANPNVNLSASPDARTHRSSSGNSTELIFACLSFIILLFAALADVAFRF